MFLHIKIIAAIVKCICGDLSDVVLLKLYCGQRTSVNIGRPTVC